MMAGQRIAKGNVSVSKLCLVFVKRNQKMNGKLFHARYFRNSFVTPATLSTEKSLTYREPEENMYVRLNCVVIISRQTFNLLVWSGLFQGWSFSMFTSRCPLTYF